MVGKPVRSAWLARGPAGPHDALRSVRRPCDRFSAGCLRCGVDGRDRGVVHRSGTATARRHTRSEPGRAGRYLVTGLQRLPYAVHAERRAGFDADAVGTPSERPGESRTGPSLQGGWIVAINETNTAWAGPWGVSFTSNLTDRVTGIGAWTEQLFIASIRNGKKSGTGRELLPPMPWRMYAKLLTTT